MPPRTRGSPESVEAQETRQIEHNRLLLLEAERNWQLPVA